MLALVAALVAVDVLASWGRIHPRVRVGGVPLGGLSRADAAARLDDRLGARLEAPVTVRYLDASWTVEPGRVGARLDVEPHVNAAWAVGREGGAGTVLADRAGAWFRPRELPASASADSSRLAAFLDEVDAGVGEPPHDAEVVVDGVSVSLVPARAGVRVVRDRLADDLLRAFVAEDRDVEAQVESAPVAVTDDAAQQALADAKAMVAGTVTVTYKDDRWEFPAEAVGGWIAFRAVPAAATSSGTAESTSAAEVATGAAETAATLDATPTGPMVLVAEISPDALADTVGPKVKGLGRAPEDARFVTDAGRVTIVPSRDGVQPDMEGLARAMTGVLTGSGPRSVELRTRRLEPEITTEKARTMGIKERLSKYTTTYSAGNKPRVNNIHTLAAALDGALVPPGGTFSFNGTVGQRTAEKGYQEAPAIVNGKLLPQLGGGICQVGTTVFNAVFFSGLPVVERRNHSFYISHYPKGRDATVSWGGPDFKFRNDTEHWVLVKTAVTAGSLTVALYGTDPGYEVVYETGPFTDIRPHPVKEVKDPSMPLGARIVEDAGVDGRRVVVKRTVTKGGRVVRTDTFVSSYKSKEEVVRVGTKKPAGSETATPAVSGR